MLKTLTVSEVVALSGLEEKQVRKEVEYGVLKPSSSSPKFRFPALVYFRTLAQMKLQLRVEDRRALYEAVTDAVLAATIPTRIPFGGVLELPIAATARSVRNQLERFEAWKSKLVQDEAILGGEPVFPKSRLAVRQVGGMLLKGASPDEIKADYPYLTDKDIELAKLYTKAYPRVGRPRGAKASAR
jgi:uncharacterized protein (DUF433 family)